MKTRTIRRYKKRAALTRSQFGVRDFALIYRSSPVERIMLVKRGIAASEVSAVAKIVGRSKQRFMAVLGLPRATIDRNAKSNKNLSTEHAERLLGFAKLAGQVQVMVEESGDPTDFSAAVWLAEWLERPQPALGGKMPAEFMDTSEGQQLVSSLLGRMQSGAFA